MFWGAHTFISHLVWTQRRRKPEQPDVFHVRSVNFRTERALNDRADCKGECSQAQWVLPTRQRVKRACKHGDRQSSPSCAPKKQLRETLSSNSGARGTV